MALLQAIKGGVLATLRLPVAAPASHFLLRGFAADASYLDKQAVTDRVLNTVKGFEKIEASKVREYVRAGQGACLQHGPAPQGVWQPYG